MTQDIPPALTHALGPLAGQAWAATLIWAVFAGAKVLQIVKQSTNGNSRHSESSLSPIATSLNASAVALAQIAERLSNVPTKLELAEAVTELQHDQRTVVMEAQTGIVMEIHDARDHVLAAIQGRSPAAHA